MDILILSVYSLFCWIIFKFFKVPVNQWTLTTAILGGVLFIVSIMLMMNYSHPYAPNSRVYFVTTPIISNVSSVVTRVNVQEQSDVKKGDTLFTLDSTVYVSKVKSLNASLNLYRTRLKQSKRLLKAHAGSAYDVELYQSEIQKVSADLIKAKWNLAQCVIVAPTDGTVTQQRLRVGMRAVPFPMRPLMTFVHSEKLYVIASMVQNPLQQLEIGNHAEIIFDAIPGVVFQGKVHRIIKFIAQGEIQVSGTLHNFDQKMPQGTVPIMIEITDDTSDYFIPHGAKAQVAIYSDHMKPVKLVRMVLLRMKGWLNFVFGEH